MYNLQDVLQSKAQRVFSPKEKSAVAVMATHSESMGKIALYVTYFGTNYST
jgi:hypothetical protein